MYKIIKPRQKNPLCEKREVKCFACGNCGCVFETDEWYETIPEDPYRNLGTSTFCPECGALLQRGARTGTQGLLDSRNRAAAEKERANA